MSVLTAASRKNMKRSVLYSLMTVCAMVLWSGVAVAQLSPPISPWMSMFQRRQGPLDNYNAFVKPQQDMLKNYQAQQQQIQRNSQALQSMQTQNLTGGKGVDLAGRASGSLDPNKSLLNAPQELPSGQSIPASYGNYLHYYQTAPMGRVPNFSQPGSGRRR
jgi:hypothetical protein